MEKRIRKKSRNKGSTCSIKPMTLVITADMSPIRAFVLIFYSFDGSALKGMTQIMFYMLTMFLFYSLKESFRK